MGIAAWDNVRMALHGRRLIGDGHRADASGQTDGTESDVVRMQRSKSLLMSVQVVFDRVMGDIRGKHYSNNLGLHTTRCYFYHHDHNCLGFNMHLRLAVGFGHTPI